MSAHTAPRRSSPPRLGPREPDGAGRPGLHSPPQPERRGAAAAAPRAAPFLPPPGHRRGRRSASGLLPADPGPATLHLVPNSARRSPVSCIDPEAAFMAQQQHATLSHVSRPLREWEGAPEEWVLPHQARVAIATGCLCCLIVTRNLLHLLFFFLVMRGRPGCKGGVQIVTSE